MNKQVFFTSFLSIIITFFAYSNQHFEVVRGQRPPIDLNIIPPNAIEPGKIQLKIKPHLHKQLPDIALYQKEHGYVETGILQLDTLNKLYRVSRYTPLFASLYETNRPADAYRERHKAWGFHLWFELELDNEADIRKAVADFLLLDEIDRAAPVFKKELDYRSDAHTSYPIVLNEIKKRGWMPDDPDFGAQWHYHNTGQTGGTAGADISLTAAWEIEKGNPDVIVAIVDGGIDYMHHDLAGNMWEDIGYNFVNNSSNVTPHNHGTHVAGTVAAVNNNATGVAGVAGGSGSNDGVRLMSCQVFTGYYSGGFHLAPVYAADNGAAISQNSWGYSYPGIYEEPVLDAIDYFNLHGGGDAMSGGITIFSAGNSNSSGSYYPGCYEGAFAVAATNHNDQKAYYSNFDTWVDVSAPGGETINNNSQGVLSTLNNNSYGFYQGTSMASPHCSGVAALLISAAYGTMDAQTLAEIIRSTADDHYDQNQAYEGMLGTGRINAFEALQQIGTGNPPANLVATPGDYQVILGWEPPQPDTLILAGYNVYRNNDLINSEPIADETFEDTNVINNTTYEYFVKAVYGSSESVRSNIVKATPNSGFADGDGTANNPFLVSAAEQLNNTRYYPIAYFKQTANIDLDIHPFNTGEGWLPIGTQQIAFSGNYDGNTFLIENLFINRPDTDHVGLFGYIIDGEIQKTGVVNADVSARNRAGVIAGKLQGGAISQSFVTGYVSANDFSGGIAGQIIDGTLSDSYASANVAGNKHAGGLVGSTNSTITSSYSVGMVQGNIHTGGLIGSQENNLTSNSYWNVETSSQNVSAAGMALTTNEMLQPESYINWAFESVWIIQPVITYPFLAWQEDPGIFNHPPQHIPPSCLEANTGTDFISLTWQAPSMGSPEGYYMYRNGIIINDGVPIEENSFTDNDIIGFELYTYYATAIYDDGHESQPSNSVEAVVSGFSGGAGTAANPFLIETAYQLNAVREYPDAHYMQISNIDLDNAPWNEGEGWAPIGDEDNPFTGSYDGNGHRISNLFIERPQNTYVGLFGKTSGATIKNLMLNDAYVHGWRYVGGLAGYIGNHSLVEHVYVENIDLHIVQRHGGGLVGYVHQSEVFRCYSTGSLLRDNYWEWNSIGGLIGSITTLPGSDAPSVVEESFSTVYVKSLEHNVYGGLIGSLWVHTEINNCYTRGSVQGNGAWAGGLLAELKQGNQPMKVNNSYAATYVNAPGSNVNGFLGYNEGGQFLGNFWDVEVSDQPGSDPAATGKTTDEMKTSETFISAGWDFDEVWKLDTAHILNNGYPFLQWQLDVCKPPDSIVATNITSTTAGFIWDELPLANRWKVTWGEHGFDPNDPDNPAAEVATAGFTMSNLENGITYDIYVSTKCYDNLYNSWSEPITFTTVKQYTLNGGGLYCEGDDPTNINAWLEGSETGFQYRLYNDNEAYGNPVQGTGDILSWNNLVAGNYTVYAFSGIHNDWMTSEAVVTESPLPDVSFILDSDTLCIDHEPVVLSGGYPAGGHYEGNAVIDDIFYPNIAGEGEHTIYYFYADELGCENADSVIVYVDPCVSVNEIPANAQVKIYPNPASDKLYIEFGKHYAELASIQLINKLGVILQSHQNLVAPTIYALDISHIKPGFYFVRFVMDDQVFTLPVIIK